MIALILADPDKDFDREIRWALKGNKDISVRAFATKLDQIEALVKEHAPCVLLIGPGWKGKPIADLAKDIREKTNTTVILSVNGSKPYNQKKAASAHTQGIDFLTFPTRTDELISTIQRAYEILRETIASTGNKGKILTIFSTKGGVGKTVIATNLAVSLARDHGTSVVLLDLDLQFGDIGVMLKLNPEHTIYDAACMGENLDIEVLSGLSCLPRFRS
ncbi:MAG: P-loop NTPase [Actinomycetota bacterium]|nr:P-loop NTPase [Actinomycetota bacterium]